MADKTTAIQSLARTQLVDKDGFITAPWLKAMSLENRDLRYLLGLEPRNVNEDASPRIPDVMPLLTMEPDAHRIPDLMPLLAMQDQGQGKDKRLDDALAYLEMVDEPRADKREFAILESLIHFSCEQSAGLARKLQDHDALLAMMPDERKIKQEWPVGSIFLSVVTTNPSLLLGYGTWTQIAEGQMLVGFLTADPDFGTLEGTGGAKTHHHSVDVGDTASGGPSATVLAITDIAGTAVGDGSHHHHVDPASVDSSEESNLRPFFVIYAWKRTA